MHSVFFWSFITESVKINELHLTSTNLGYYDLQNMSQTLSALELQNDHVYFEREI